MRKLTRRSFIELGVSATVAASVLPAFAAKGKVKFKVGVTDWNLKLEDKLESIALAKSLGFDGVQVSIGKVTGSLTWTVSRRSWSQLTSMWGAAGNRWICRL